MPQLCIECDSRVERSALTKTTYWCPGCEKEIKKDETYKVSKRFFAKGVGAILAAVAALKHPDSSLTEQTKTQAISTLLEMKRQQRKKLKGLKMKQQRHIRQKGGRK